MKTLSQVTRARLEMQGFINLSDDELLELRPWLRLSPIITIAWMAVGIALASARVIWALLPFSILGAILPGHPFDVIYNFGLRYFIGGRKLPRYHWARRVCCLLASLWTAGVGWAFHTGAIMFAYVLGGMFISAALLPVTIDFCIPSYLYSLIFGKPASCGVMKK